MAAQSAEQLLVHFKATHPNCPHTLIAAIESSWMPATSAKLKSFELPNGNVVKGEFRGTWGQLEQQLVLLEELLDILLPPKGFRGTWKFRIPEFCEVKNRNAITDEFAINLEPIPSFCFSGKGLVAVPEFPPKPRYLRVPETPKISLPKKKRTCNNNSKKPKYKTPETQAEFIYGKEYKFNDVWELCDLELEQLPQEVECIPPKLVYARNLRKADYNTGTEIVEGESKCEKRIYKSSESNCGKLIYKSSELIRLNHSLCKRVKGLLDKGSRNRRFKIFRQIANIPGVKRQTFQTVSGQVKMAHKQSFAYVEFPKPMGGHAVVDFIQPSDDDISSDDFEIHDCTNEGFILSFLGESNSGFHVRWRALHSKWRDIVEVLAGGHSVQWNIEAALKKGVIVDYPCKPFEIPAVWTEEENRRYIEEATDVLEFESMKLYQPPELPEILPPRLRGYHALFIIDTTPDTLRGEYFQRMKFLLRNILSVQHLQQHFGVDGSLTMVTTSGNQRFDLNSLDDCHDAQQWVAGLSVTAAVNWRVVFSGVKPAGNIHIITNDRSLFVGMEKPIETWDNARLIVLNSAAQQDLVFEDYTLIDENRYFVGSIAQISLANPHEEMFLKCLDIENAVEINDMADKQDEWEIKKAAYDRLYQEEEEDIRQYNRGLLNQAKSVRDDFVQSRLEAVRSIQVEVNRDLYRKVCWKWGTMARVYHKRHCHVQLNMFLAISSAYSELKANRTEEARLRTQDETSDCIANVLVSILELTMVQVSRQAIARHVDNKQHTEISTDPEPEKITKQELRRRGKIKQVSDRLLMQPEEAFQAKVNKAMYFGQVILRKHSAMQQLLRDVFGRQSCLSNPVFDPNDVLNTFMPLKSHQMRVMTWHQEMCDMEKIQMVEARSWRESRADFIQILASRHDQREIESETKQYDNSEFMNILESKKQELKLHLRTVERSYRPAIVKGWRLYLHVAPFTKCARFARVQMSQGTTTLEVLGLLDRIELELQNGQEDQVLLEIMQEFTGRHSTKDLKCLGKLTDPFNSKLVSIFNARTGKFSKNISNDESFSLQEVVHARNTRQYEALQAWVQVAFAHWRAENKAADMKCNSIFQINQYRIKAQNQRLVKQEKINWEKNIKGPVSKRNSQLLESAQQHQRDAIDEQYRENERELAQAKVRYQVSVLEPLEEFNSSVSKLAARTKAALEEKKLLAAFRESLSQKSKQRVVPTEVVTTALAQAFNKVSLAGSAVKVVRRKRASKPI